MNIASKNTVESTTTPGVRFTVRRLNQYQRAKRDMGMLEIRSKITAANERLKSLIGDDKKIATENLVEASRLDAQIGMDITMHIKPATILAGLVSIEGLQVDGVDAKPQDVIEHASDELVDEIYQACDAAAGLSGEQQKNSQSSGISTEAGLSGEMNISASVAAS